MSNDVIADNPSAASHTDWEVRSLLAMSGHVKLGGLAQLFEFRRQGTNTRFQFVFVGGGLGAGFLVGSNTPFVSPYVFARDTVKLVGRAFWETGRSLSGRAPRDIKQPQWEEAITGFTPLKCESAFSAIDLHRSFGRLTTACATVSMGYGATVISARTLSKVFFESQSMAGGQAGGVGLGGSINAGMWLQVRS